MINPGTANHQTPCALAACIPCAGVMCAYDVLHADSTARDASSCSLLQACSKGLVTDG
jgi:hypothetical protein